MNKQELIKSLKLARDTYSNENRFRGGVRTGLGIALGVIEELEEPKKVVIPQFVADYIELCKGWNGDRQAYTEDDIGLWFALADDTCGMSNSVSDWLFNDKKVETFARAWLDGYEVKKEKLYYVLNRQGDTLLVTIGGKVSLSVGYAIRDDNKELYQLTEKQIKDFDERYWEFAVEVED